MALVSDLQTTGGRTDRGLTWLVGCDGNDVTDRDPAAAEAQHRMLVRRREPVRIPHGDRMPEGLPEPYVDGTMDR